MTPLRLLFSAFLLATAALPASGANAYPAIVIDAERGTVLHEVEALRAWYPASLTKMMTLYLTFEALASGELKLGERLHVSPHAGRQPATRLGLHAGDTLSVEDAILAVATVSANDAAAVLAERLAGREAAFAQRMTARAAALGMQDTLFFNATGLPHAGQQTTARDMALLGLRLFRDFPRYFHFFSNPSITFHGRTRPTTNRLIRGYAGTDGIKIGFTCGSGYNLVASVRRGARHLIGVVLGAASTDDRSGRMARLLDTAFAKGVSRTTAVSLTELAAPGRAAEKAPPHRLAAGKCAAGTRMARTSGRAAIAGDAKQPERPETPRRAEAKEEKRFSGWGLMLGVYSEKRLARAIIDYARYHLDGIVSGDDTALLPREFERGTSWKALVTGLEQSEAGDACKRLRDINMICVVYSPAVLNEPGFALR